MPGPSYGVDQQYAAIIEAAYDTAQSITASNCLGLIDLKITPTLEYRPSMEHLGSSDLTHEFEGKRFGQFVARAYVKPRTAGTAPDIHPLLLASFGASSGSSYSLANVINSLQLMKFVGDSYQETITGGWVETMEVDVVGNQEPIITFSGGFATMGFLRGTPLTTGSAAAGASTVAMAAAHAGQVKAPAQLGFGSNTNSGAGYRVTGVSSDGLTLTITPVVAGSTITTGTAIQAHYPTATYAGTLQGGIACDLTIAGTSVGFISYKLRLETGFHPLMREANTNRPNRVGRGKRKITGSCSFYLLDENAARFGRTPWDGTTQSLACRVGPNTADNRFTLTTPAVRLSVHEVDVPDEEEATFEAQFTARRASVNNDALTGVFA